MFEKKCMACSGKIDKGGSITSYEVRRIAKMVDKVDNVSPYKAKYGDGNTKEVMSRQMNDVFSNLLISGVNAYNQAHGETVDTVHSHDNLNCLAKVNGSVGSYVSQMEDLQFVRMSAKIGKKVKFATNLLYFQNGLGISFEDRGAHEMMRLHHDRKIVITVLAGLRDTVAANIPVPLRTDHDAVRDRINDAEYAEVVGNAEKKYESSGGYGKDWPVKLEALKQYLFDTVIPVG